MILLYTEVLKRSGSWKTTASFYPLTIAEVVRGEIGEDIWRKAEERVRSERNLTTGVRGKNCVLIAAVLEALEGDGVRSNTLDELCDRILAFATKPTSPEVSIDQPAL